MINPAHFDLQTLRIFLLVADSGSLTRAAERAHMTLSAISKRIGELEKTIDCELLVRLPRGIELTPAGVGLREHAQRVIEQVNRMAGEMSDFAVGVRGHVRMWVNTSAVVQFLPNDIAEFLSENAGIHIGLEEKLSVAIIEALNHGRADLGVFADNVPSPGIEKKPYRSDDLVLLVPRGHPLDGLKEIAFADTLEYGYVALNEGSSLLKRMVTAATATEKTLRIRIQVSSFDGICRMIEAGLGIGVLPRAAVRPEILGTRLHAITLIDAWAHRTLWIGRSATAVQPEAIKLFNFLAGRQ
ncbi:LysR family transcriptional regulator [Herbaspirillum sp. NPDC087042]|uniref:LysR family transcriptional regulator n=1 Tax=Herbaspirillum sp. NPDC087042 TaxID=3364004 RepID=UPI0037FB41E6